jgi:putative phosphoesterase
MRIGIISDIHGNLVALEAALSALEKHQPDRIVCLGDVAADGPNPVACVRRLDGIGCDVVIGNTDADLLSGERKSSDDELMQKFYEMEAWGIDQLSDADIALMKNYQATIEVQLDVELKMLCYHGSPNSFHDIIKAETPVESIEPWFAGFDAQVLNGGHTHIQMLRRWENRVIVNCGSVGMPYDAGRNPLWAEYAVIDVQDGQPSISLCRTPLELGQLRESALNSDMPHAEWWLSEWG